MDSKLTSSQFETMATLDDLQGAMNALRAEISGLVSPQIAARITGLRSEVDVTVTGTLKPELRFGS